MLTCYRTRRRIGAYLDRALDEETAHSTATHLASCGGCRREADELRRLHTLLQGTAAVSEPDWTGLWPGVVRGIQDARSAPVPQSSRVWWQPRWALGSVVAAAVLVSLGVWQLTPGPVPVDAGVVVSSARTEDPRATLMVYSNAEQDVAVVWVLGLDN